MAMSEQFSLRWNDFHSNLSQSFHALLEGEDLVDVTLAAGGQYVHAHKLILSVCSPYFKELFKMNPCEHPIVILKDVAHQELRQLLQFMYLGEVHVRQQELLGFLHTAEMLQVKGLTVGRETSESPPASVEEPPKSSLPGAVAVAAEAEAGAGAGAGAAGELALAPGGEDIIATEALVALMHEPSPKDEARSPLKRLLKTKQKNSFNSAKKERRAGVCVGAGAGVGDAPIIAPQVVVPLTPDANDYDNEPLIDFDNDFFHSVPESAKAGGWNCKSGGVKCPSCHRFFANRYNLKVHIRDKHDTREGTLQCEVCQKRMRNPSCLRVHMYHHRKQAAYLAQLSNQPDHMTQVIQNMAVSKWRSGKDASPTAVDYREFDALSNTPGGKWRKDAQQGSDFGETDNCVLAMPTGEASASPAESPPERERPASPPPDAKPEAHLAA